MASDIRVAYIPTPSYCLVEEDPLNDTQKSKISSFVQSYLLTSQTVEYNTPYGPRTRFQNIFEKKETIPFEEFRAMYKTYDGFDPVALAAAEKEMGAEAFRTFRNTLKNPATQAEKLGLDPQNHGQVFAAQIFMKQVIEGIRLDRGLDDVHGKYRDRMVSSRGRDHTTSSISIKNKMLMKQDPIKKLDLSKPIKPLDIILANAHFIEPIVKITQQSNNEEPVTTLHGPSREKARGMLQDEFTKLVNNPEITHITDALGTLIHKEKGHIFFSGTPHGVGSLGAPYNARSTTLGGVEAFYNCHHSIMAASIINPYDQSIKRGCFSTFIHESLHFLFDRIVKNNSSPVEKNSAEEKLLDLSLERDRIHRKGIDCQKLTSNQQSVWETLVDLLEKEASYFPGGFDANSPSHLHTMRVESIVRVMEQITLGCSRADVEAIAPNLCKFYFEYSKPLLEKFVNENPLRGV